MEILFFSICLMLFLIWSNKLINNHFKTSQTINSIVANNENNEKSDKNHINKFLPKQLFLTVLLFIGCYLFTYFVVNSNRYTASSNKNQASDLTEMLNKFENNKDQNQQNQQIIKVISPLQIKTKFSDVAGLYEAKDELQDVIKFLKNPSHFQRLGAKAPKGILMYGPPGNGKTLLARAIAGETSSSFISVSGSQFEEEYVGVGAARIRQLFEIARKNAPCIIFIDEIDSVAFKRHSQQAHWAAQTVNQLLTEMDGLDDNKNEGVIVLAASNRIDALDPAILRPGRLDRHIKLEYPTISERAESLKIFIKNIKVNRDVTSNKIAKITPGFSYAELANLVNEAAIYATKHNKNSVDFQSFELAKDRIILGSKRKALQMTEKERQITAYHEAGHALVGSLLGKYKHQPLYKVTIAPRGPSLGHTSFEPKDSEYSMSLIALESHIASQLSGRIAEELIFGEKEVTTGAESDLQNATKMAYNMVTRWGYSKKLGPIYYSEELNFIPKETIESEIKSIIQNSYNLAKELLILNKNKLHKIAAKLLENETLDAKEVQEIINS